MVYGVTILIMIFDFWYIMVVNPYKFMVFVAYGSGWHGSQGGQLSIM